MNAPMIPVRFAVEHSDARENGYHKIHAAGCRDLRDGETFACAPTVEGLWSATDGMPPYWHDWASDAEEAREEILRDLAPCARKLVRA